MLSGGSAGSPELALVEELSDASDGLLELLGISELAVEQEVPADVDGAAGDARSARRNLRRRATGRPPQPRESG